MPLLLAWGRRCGPTRKAESMILNQPKQRHYDVIILGSGPAGITTALELSKDPSLKIAVIESGLLDPHPTIQTLAGVQLHGDLTDDYFPICLLYTSPSP